MAVTSLTDLRSRFQSLDKPTAADFRNLIDTLVSLAETPPPYLTPAMFYPGVFTFANLPTLAAAGSRAFITDGKTAPVWGAAAVGGGTTPTPVYYDGTAWHNG